MTQAAGDAEDHQRRTRALAARYPVLESTAYLNAGTCGPLAEATVDAMQAALALEGEHGRGITYYDRLMAASAELRGRWARLFEAPTEEIALTLGTTDGIARTLAAQSWTAGDEVLTSDEEHPGVTGPLGALQRRHGVRVRTAPFDELAQAVDSSTRLVVASHVGWLSGRVLDVEAVGRGGAPVLLDGAQGAAAVPVDVRALREQGVVAYAAPGQKWACGPVGTGALWISEAWAPDHGAGVWPAYENLADPMTGLEATPRADARRFDSPSLSVQQLVGAAAALSVLEEAGWDEVHARGIDGAARLAGSLRDAGIEVLERGASTLVTWRPDDADALLARADEAGILLRGFPGLPYVRASVGAWTVPEHVQRLLDVAVR